MSAVALEHVTLQLGGRAVLSDVSFEIQAGEFIGVLGPNGAGKTTLMRAILGLLAPGAGRIKVFGQAPECGNPAIGYLPQLRTVLPDLRIRGRDVIAGSLNGERWGLALTSRRDRLMVEETLEAVGARELANRPLAEMSGGERQRLLARTGADRVAKASAARRATDQPRRPPSGNCDRCRAPGSAASGRSPCCSVRTNSTSFLGRSTACSISATAMPCSASVEEVVTAPILSKLFGTEIQVLRADGHIFVMSRGLDVERTDHLHDHGHDHGHHHHH